MFILFGGVNLRFHFIIQALKRKMMFIASGAQDPCRMVMDPGCAKGGG